MPIRDARLRLALPKLAHIVTESLPHRVRVRQADPVPEVDRALAERRHAELDQLSRHDALTGLPDRDLFKARLQHAISHARAGERLAVLFLGLDRFTNINDTFGHRFGDLILCGIGQRLRGALRKSDMVARLNGDEFAVLLTGLAGDDHAGDIASVLVQSCTAPFLIDGREATPSCSVGVAIYPDQGRTAEELLHAAEAAQSRAKDSGSNWQIYAPDMLQSRNTVLTVSALRQRLKYGGLAVHYQPIVDLVTDQIHSVEALVRWPDDSVAAIDIVHLAESSGLIVPLTEFVMRSAFLQMREWDLGIGRRDLRLAINVSAVQVSRPGMLDTIDRLTDESGFDPSRLDLELTERAAMRASPAVQASLDEMRARGITVTLDDFGTGYSALSRLERLPIDAMKIDKSFLERVGHGGNGVVARAIIAIGHSLGKRVVAEGVETREQLDFLRREGCRYAQGYYLGRPVDSKTITTVLRRQVAETRNTRATPGNRKHAISLVTNVPSAFGHGADRIRSRAL